MAGLSSLHTPQFHFGDRIVAPGVPIAFAHSAATARLDVVRCSWALGAGCWALPPEVIIATLEDRLPTSAKAAFPVRVASLDIGSNAIRYTVAEFNDAHHFVEIESQRFAVRLGHDAFTTGRLSQQSIDGALEAAFSFRQRLDDLGIAHYRAVATSALRESRNGGELVETVRRESGIHLETISGSEEARLVWLATHHLVSLDRRPWILADLGGGSIEISIISEEGIHWSESHPMGTVRILEELASEAGSLSTVRELVERYASRIELPEGTHEEVEGVILTGGNAEALADLVQAPSDARGVSEMSRDDLRRILGKLAGMTFEERVRDLGLREDRADVIVPAAVIFDRIAELGKAERILVPRVGVKEGVLLDLVFDYAEHRAHESELDRVTRAGAIAVGRRYRFDEPHARHVAELSLSLFDQLAERHGLNETSRRRLETAALLHDIGQFVSYRRHHKHSWYLVTHSELPGLSQRDVRLVALVTRYHRRSEPKDYHEGFKDLNAPDRLEVQKLAAILRVADALDHEHRRRVRSVELRIKGNRASLILTPEQDTLLEQWALKKKSSLFEKIYDLKVQIGERA